MRRCRASCTRIESHRGFTRWWGSNQRGQLGYDTPDGEFSRRPHRIDVHPLRVVKIACGDDFTVMLDQQGRVYYCGLVLSQPGSLATPLPIDGRVVAEWWPSGGHQLWR